MRLDKYLCETTKLSRADAKKAILRGRVKVADALITNPAQKIDITQTVLFDSAPLTLTGPIYIALHKPQGYICSTQDEVHPCVLNLIEHEKKDKLHPAGRLDVDTTGLVLLTDDGQWSHRVTSPKKSCAKTYFVALAEPLREDAVERCQEGIMLNNETKPTLPAKLEMISPTQVKITLQEGKYHQVKRMFAALDNKVIGLHRATIGHVDLTDLAEGEWRYLTAQEVAQF
ncbi:16S rRNA pseudouridine(516) synthase RsuA [Motilimonas cestriensis]|uniref:16S rRNA pseudouridine(516) synthase RsuA n=1 Tax=Motilimonas cestriensis TaxID=2742685 RepID=UPI003DA381D1